ncbi:MAG: hypothetical protein J0M08_04655 [Bacteroidetes bacterium]|nr:hypothetical protein [Bacteroidota bacterium]
MTNPETKNKTIAAAVTIGLHAALFLYLFFKIIVTPLPPFPIEEGGIELGVMDFGNLTEGTGNTEDVNMGEAKTTENSTPQKTNQASQPEGENVLTSDAEPIDVSVVKNTKAIKVKNNVEAPVVKPVEEAPSSDLLNALNKMKNKKSGSSGGDGNSGKPGNEGDPNGKPGGEGLGDSGPGKGAFKYDLKGRRIVRAPDIIDDSQEEGKVVVEIMVDETGKVVKATPGGRGSTTTSALLYAKARQAALGTKFNSSTDGMKEQSGSITFVFILN